jgi:hypothetical protein
MRYFFLFTLAIFAVLTSCSKDDNDGKTCWSCNVKGFSASGTYYDYWKDTCTNDNVNPPQFTDPQGNQIGSSCTKK